VERTIGDICIVMNIVTLGVGVPYPALPTPRPPIVRRSTRVRRGGRVRRARGGVFADVGEPPGNRPGYTPVVYGLTMTSPVTVTRWQSKRTRASSPVPAVPFRATGRASSGRPDRRTRTAGRVWSGHAGIRARLDDRYRGRHLGPVVPHSNRLSRSAGGSSDVPAIGAVCRRAPSAGTSSVVPGLLLLTVV
jgi:hypothetical protein